jgi:hypothetical protein
MIVGVMMSATGRGTGSGRPPCAKRDGICPLLAQAQAQPQADVRRPPTRSGTCPRFATPGDVLKNQVVIIGARAGTPKTMTLNLPSGNLPALWRSCQSPSRRQGSSRSQERRYIFVTPAPSIALVAQTSSQPSAVETQGHHPADWRRCGLLSAPTKCCGTLCT